MKKSTKNVISGLIGIIAIVVVVLALGTLSHNGPSLSTTSTGQVASLSVLAPSGMTVDAGQIEKVLWSAFNYQPQTVSVAVIRKVSDNPARYEIVRTVALSTKNDGSAVWVPSTNDVGTNTFVQVGCTLSNEACTAGISAAPLAVVNDGRYANTAATYQSIEASQN